MILLCCASELGLPEDLSAIEVILYYYYYYNVICDMRYVRLYKPNELRINAFEMKCYRKILRIP